MLSRRRLALAAAAASLLFVAGAAADPADNKFTATSVPSVVRPAPIAVVYAVKLVNDPAPSADADRATITPPAGFDVVGTPPAPTVTGCGDIQPWTIDVLTDETIAVSRNGSSANNLCPGGTLTVVFSATAAVAEGTYQWAAELRRGDVGPPFVLHDAQLSIQVDNTAPQTSISSSPVSPTNQASASFAFTSNEAGSSFECRRDSGAFVACTSPQAYLSLAEGMHTFDVRAIDPAGNVDASPAGATWTVDLTAPTTTIASAPPVTTNQIGANFTFTSNEAGSTFECRRDGAAFAVCTSPQAYLSLGAGVHTFDVRAIDPAGNVDASPASHTWTIDLTAPTTSITSAPPTPTNQTSASFAFASSEAGSTFQCRRDGQAFAACTSPQAYQGLAAGAHTFDVRAIDPAGNVDASPATDSWTIDLTAPTTTIASGPPATTNQTNASFTFTSNEAGSTFQCRRDGQAFAACTSPHTYQGLAAGAHTFDVRAIDPAGNVDGSPASQSWTIDVTPPDTTISSGPTSPTNQTTASFTFTTTEAGSTFECSLDVLDGGNFTPCVSPKSYSGLPGGGRTFRVRARDAAGNIDPSPASRDWTIDLVGAATTILTAPPSSTASSSASFTFAASEAGTTFACRLDGALFSPCTSPTTYGNLVDGSHSFAVRAIDASNNTGPEATHSWKVDTRAPRATVVSGPPALSNSRSATLAFSADEPSSFQCRRDNGVLTPCGSPASYQTLPDGAHTFTVTPTDQAGNTGAASSYAWTIDATAPETAVVGAPRSGTTVVSATFSFSASETARFECRRDGAAFGPCSSPKRYSGLTRRTHTFEVRAIDSAGNVDSTPAARRWRIVAVARSAKALTPLFSPRTGARISSAPTLRWRPVTRASYYNVQLYRGRDKVLSTWPTQPRLRLRTSWTYLGKRLKLSVGIYRWYVWPGYGKPVTRRYGRLLGQSTFTVTARR